MPPRSGARDSIVTTGAGYGIAAAADTGALLALDAAGNGGTTAATGGGTETAGATDPLGGGAPVGFAPPSRATCGAIASSSPLIAFQSSAFKALGSDRSAPSIAARSVCSVCIAEAVAAASLLASACLKASASPEKLATGPSNGFALPPPLCSFSAASSAKDCVLILAA